MYVDPAFQLSDAAYTTGPVPEPLVGAFIAALDRNRLVLPASLRDTLHRSSVETVGVFVNRDHIEIVPVRCTGAHATRSRCFVGLVRDEILTAIRVLALGPRARLALPQAFTQVLDIGGSVFLMGVFDRIEIWSSFEAYAAKRRKVLAPYSQPIHCAASAVLRKNNRC